MSGNQEEGMFYLEILQCFGKDIRQASHPGQYCRTCNVIHGYVFPTKVKIGVQHKDDLEIFRQLVS